jgi:hypothetical protein
VEGPIGASRRDKLKHGVEIVEHITRRNPQRLETGVG